MMYFKRNWLYSLITLFCLILGIPLWGASSLNSASPRSHKPEAFLKKIVGSKDEGDQIVQHFCVNCHAEKPLIPLGAPRMGHAEDWAKRVSQGLEVLLKHTEEGFNGMPAHGGCFECLDEQLLLAILAMLSTVDLDGRKISKR